MRVITFVLIVCFVLGSLVGCAGLTPRQQSTVTGGAGGAAVGAALGAITGGSPAVGAAVGGGVGALGGYLLGPQINR